MHGSLGCVTTNACVGLEVLVSLLFQALLKSCFWFQDVAGPCLCAEAGKAYKEEIGG